MSETVEALQKTQSIALLGAMGVGAYYVPPAIVWHLVSAMRLAPRTLYQGAATSLVAALSKCSNLPYDTNLELEVGIIR